MAGSHSSMNVTSNPTPPKQHPTKRAIACNYCRLKKVRCTCLVYYIPRADAIRSVAPRIWKTNAALLRFRQWRPTMCKLYGKMLRTISYLWSFKSQHTHFLQDRGEDCIYLALRRRRRRSALENDEAIEGRIARMEAALREANLSVGTPGDYSHKSGSQNVSPTVTADNDLRQQDSQLSRTKEPARQNRFPPSPHTTSSNASAQGGQSDDGMCNNATHYSQLRAISVTQDLQESSTMRFGDSVSGNLSCDPLLTSPHGDGQAFSMGTILSGDTPQLQTPARTPVDKGSSSIAPPENV